MILLGALAFLPGLAMAQEKQRKKGGGESYIQINTLTGTIIRPDGRRGVMTVEAGVDVPDPALFARADASLPRLRAAYTEVIITYAAGLPAYAAPNADYLSRELQRQTDLVLGRPGARLLLGTILVN
ncbi:MAG: hypothetical protein ACHP84_11425 [Caulobacterales bacterium]